jgi:hypothetical protein
LKIFEKNSKGIQTLERIQKNSTKLKYQQNAKEFKKSQKIEGYHFSKSEDERRGIHPPPNRVPLRSLWTT